MEDSDFTATIVEEVNRGLNVNGFDLIVDSIETQKTPLADLVSIDFRLQGEGASTAEFTYTFSSLDSVDANLKDLGDFILEQNSVAGTRPPVKEAETGASV